jgi:hypothetical protein
MSEQLRAEEELKIAAKILEWEIGDIQPCGVDCRRRHCRAMFLARGKKVG